MDPAERRATERRTVHPKRLQRAERVRGLLVAFVACGVCVACGDDFPQVPSPESAGALAAEQDAADTQEPAPEQQGAPPVAVSQPNMLATPDPSDSTEPPAADETAAPSDG